MRTIIFGDTALPVIGGGQIHLHNLYRYLKKEGYRVKVFTNETRPSTDDDDYIRIPWPSRNPVAFIKFFRLILSLIKPCEVIFSLYSYRLSAAAALAARIRGKPIFIFAHGLGTILDPQAPLVHRLYRWLSLKLAAGVIGSSGELSDIARRFNNNVITLPTGVDSEAVDQNLSAADLESLKRRYKNKKIILTVRRLVPKNGIQYLIEAMPRIAASESSVKLLIIGDGRLRRQLEGRVRELDLDDFVEFLGEKPNHEVYLFMALANAVIFPSSAEAMSIACIEAMMIGTPVIATRVGGLVDLLGSAKRYGTLVDLFGGKPSTYAAPPVSSIPEARYREFAEKVTAVINRKNQSQLAEAKKFAREHYSWRTLIKAILAFTHESRGVKKFYEHYQEKILDKRYNSPYPLRRHVHQSRLRCLLSHLRLGEDVLEIGAGDGVFAVEAAKLGFKVTAVDLSFANLKQGWRLAERSGVGSRVKFLQGDAENLPFSNGQFDVVVASHILEHLPDFERGLVEVSRVAKTRAIIALPTILNPCAMIIVGGGSWWYWSFRGLWYLLLGFLKMLGGVISFKKAIDQGFYGGEQLPHLWFYPWVMKRKLKEAGFKIVSFEPDSIPLPFFNFFLPLIKFLDHYRANPVLRNFGYGSHAVVEKL